MASASISPSASPSVSPSMSPSPSPSVSPSPSPSISPSPSPSISPSPSPSPIPAGQVTYTVRKAVRIGRLKMVFVNITFGSAYEKYPLYGVPLTNGQMGLFNNPYGVIVLDSGADGLDYKWDRTHNTIRIFYPTSASGGPHVGDEFSTNVTTLSSYSLELLVVGW